VCDILTRILEDKRREVAHLRAESDPADLAARCVELSPVRSLAGAISGGREVSVIAEIKRRSPSRGPLNDNLDPVALASAYESAGAAAISVLTDSPHFGGSPADLQAARKVTGLPILRKDFVVDEIQLYESRLMGADAVLLIVAALTPENLRKLLHMSEEIGLEALVEVHDTKEATRAVECGATLIGVNNRNLRTFEVSLETSRLVRSSLPADRLCVSESGIRSRDDVVRVEEWGFDAVLVGESSVTADDPAQHIRHLRGLAP
jgi:indole-3-glycerol phosphate synthase